MLPVALCLALTAPSALPLSSEVGERGRAEGAGPQPLLAELTTQGLAIPGGPRFRLPPPAMPSGLPEAKRQAVLEKFADEFPRGVFLRRDSAAPHLWKIEAIDGNGGKRRGHQLDLYFAAYGKVENLERQDMLGVLMGTSGKKEPIYLSDKELAARKITRTPGKGFEERFVVLDMELIEKIQLSGVLRSQKRTDADGAVVSVMVLDERFADDKEYPNRWRAILEERGERVGLGPARPYSGFGGFVKATPVKGDLIFIELHFAFAEPYDWFEGRNLLASKLPLALRNNVKTTRIKLAGK